MPRQKRARAELEEKPKHRPRIAPLADVVDLDQLGVSCMPALSVNTIQACRAYAKQFGIQYMRATTDDRAPVIIVPVPQVHVSCFGVIAAKDMPARDASGRQIIYAHYRGKKRTPSRIRDDQDKSYLMERGDGQYTDALSKGNWTRSMNHSPAPNVDLYIDSRTGTLTFY